MSVHANSSSVIHLISVQVCLSVSHGQSSYPTFGTTGSPARDYTEVGLWVW